MIKIYTTKDRPLNDVEFDQLYELTRIAYAETESEMFGEDYIRIKKDEYQDFIDLNQIIYAMIDNVVVGGIRHYQVGEGTYSFGLLSVDFNYARKGIGQALIDEVENIAKSNAYHSIKIEILRPKDIDLAAKKLIGDWYQRINYNYQDSATFEEIVPQKKGLSIVPCIFDFYLKKL